MVFRRYVANSNINILKRSVVNPKRSSPCSLSYPNNKSIRVFTNYTHSLLLSLSPINYSTFQNPVVNESNKHIIKRNLHWHRKLAKKINYRIVTKGRKWHTLLTIAERYEKQFTIVNWSTLLNRLGRNDHETVQKIKEDYRYKIVKRHVIRIMVSLKDNSSDLYSISNIIHALAKLKDPIKPVFDKVEEESEWILQNMASMQISSIAWSFAKLNISAPTFFSTLDKHTLTNWNARDVSITVWSFARLKIAAPNFLKFINENAGSILENGNEQNISNVAWSCATLHQPAPNFFELLDRNAERMIRNGTPQAISNTAWAFAKLSHPAPTLYSLIDQNANEIILTAKPQAITNIAWSFATSSYKADNFFREINENVSILKWSPSDYSNVVWAFAELGYDGMNLNTWVDEHSLEFMENSAMSPQDVANVALAFGKLGYDSKHYFDNLEKKIHGCTMDIHKVCLILWSLSILNLMEKNNSLVSNLWKRVVEIDIGEFRSDDFSYLAQVDLFAKVNGIELEALPPFVQIIVKKIDWREKSSKIKDEYSNLLLEIGFTHERQVSPTENCSLFLIDYANEEKRIAIEFNDSSHFLTDLKGLLPGRENGVTMAKRRVLERLGWKVISISHVQDSEMDNNGNDGRELKKDYLRKELLKVGVSL